MVTVVAVAVAAGITIVGPPASGISSTDMAPVAGMKPLPVMVSGESGSAAVWLSADICTVDAVLPELPPAGLLLVDVTAGELPPPQADSAVTAITGISQLMNAAAFGVPMCPPSKARVRGF
ncbi:MAG TPA: hypothetical protein VMB48_13155 [Steroidobacteraceae bacterium]|nr:hypothetical protein [Steroidobacteraceae bacterium]